MNRRSAEKAIKAILKSMPDSELPELKIETGPKQDVAWHGGTGYHLGTATSAGEFSPRVHLTFGLTELFAREAVRRIDKKRGPRPASDPKET